MASTWGVCWGGDIGAWLTSWSRIVTPQPEPETPAVQPAGRKTKRRYYVEIDGQQFEVENASQAVQLLERARALAERAAESAAKKVEAKASRAAKPRPFKIQAPRITASPELGIDLAPFRSDISRIYDSAAALAELRLLLQRAIEDDEEEAILLLM